MLKIGVMGAEGSFSEQAGEFYLTKKMLKDAEIVPLVTADKVLSSLEQGLIDEGLFPVMNNNGGLVIEALHAMGAYNFKVEDIFEMDIQHMLLSLPGITKEMIMTITSHDQAIKQCRGYLDREWTKAMIVPYADTAKAAADLAKGILQNNTAVIASKRAGDLYGLTILDAGIQDAKINKTTFVVAKKRE